MRYHAFISYSHGADARLAPSLQHALHRFAKPWWRLRAVDVFRDETSLAAAHSLPDTLTRALEASEHFILLASPMAARSQWVGTECAWWARHKDPQRMLVVLTDGAIAWDAAAGDFDWEKSDALPPALKGVFKQEPLYIDLRWTKAAADFSTRDPRFLDAVARIGAALRGMRLDEIAGEEVRQHRKTRRIAAAAFASIALLAVGAGAGAWIAAENAHEAERQRAAAERRRADAEAQRRLAEERRVEAERQTKIADGRLENALLAVDVMLREIAYNLKNLPGVSAQRFRDIVKKGEAIVDRIEEVGDTPATRRLRIGVHIYLVDAYRALGDRSNAMGHALGGMKLAVWLTSRHRDDMGIVMIGAAMIERYGDVVGDGGETDEALRAYRSALGLLAIVPARGEDEFGVKHDSVVLYQKIGHALLRLNQSAAALGQVRNCEVVLAAVPAGKTEAQRAQRARLPAVCRELKARVLVSLGRADEALDALRDQLEDRRKAAAAAKDDTEAQRDVVASALAYAQPLVQRGDNDRALAVLDEAMRIVDRLLAADPSNVRWAEDRVRVHRWVGVAHAGKLEWDRALAAYAMSKLALKHLRNLAPERSGLAHQEGLLLMLEGEALQGKGSHALALERYRAAEKVLEPLPSRDPKDRGVLLDYVAVKDRIALNLFQHGDLREALAALNAMAPAIARMLDLDPSWPDALKAEYMLQMSFGDVHYNLRDLKEARRHYQRGLDLAQRLPSDARVAADIATLKRALAALPQ